MAEEAKPPGKFTILFRSWMLTLIVPGLGQMRYGARGRGLATLAVVAASLLWLGWADYVVINQMMAAKVAQSAGSLSAGDLIAACTDPLFLGKLTEASSVPGTIFLVSFLFAFADCAYIAFTREG